MFPKPRSVAFILTGLLLVLSAMAAAQVQSVSPPRRSSPSGTGQPSMSVSWAGRPTALPCTPARSLSSPARPFGRDGTEDYEELIVVLEGQGSMILSGGARLDVKAGMALYCPTDTEHDILTRAPAP